MSVVTKVELFEDAAATINVSLPGTADNSSTAMSTTSSGDFAGPLSCSAPDAVDEENDLPAPHQHIASADINTIAHDLPTPGALQRNDLDCTLPAMGSYSPQSFVESEVQPTQPSILDLTSEEAFPPLVTAGSSGSKTSTSKLPDRGIVRPSTQAMFDPFLPAREIADRLPPNLGVSNTVPTIAPASLSKSHGQTAGKIASSTQMDQTPIIAATTDHDDSPFTPASLPKVDEAALPELSSLSLVETRTDAQVNVKKAKTSERKLVRESLKDFWWDREEARKKVSATFDLEGAQDLQRKTIIYLEKRSALCSLMSSGELNDSDAAMFPELGLMDLAVPKVKALMMTAEEMRIRKRESKAALAKVVGDAPSSPPPQSGDIETVIKDMANAQRHRQEARESDEPPLGTTRNVWLKMRARADKQYCRKYDILTAAYPAGLPAELATRFPPVSLIN